MWAGTLALGLTYGAYGSEIVRGALNAVAPAQREGGIALSFTPWQRMRLILLPQAVPEMIPPFNNLLIELLKGTALVSVMHVARHDLRRRTWCGSAPRRARRSTPLPASSTSCIAFLLTRGMRGLERNAKANVGQAPPKKRAPHAQAVAREAATSAAGRDRSREVSDELGLGRRRRLHAALLGRACWSPCRHWPSAR